MLSVNIESAAQPCPCGSAKTLASCCGIYHAGVAAPTAEQLMRSRYSAYVLGLINYLVATTLPSQRAALDVAAMTEWSQQSQWLGLQVLNHTAYPDKHHAHVTFVAQWQDDAGTYKHPERSLFVKPADRWYFIDPTHPIKLGRNDACLCGSGGKYKKCCGPFIAGQ